MPVRPLDEPRAVESMASLRLTLTPNGKPDRKTSPASVRDAYVVRESATDIRFSPTSRHLWRERGSSSYRILLMVLPCTNVPTTAPVA